MEITRTQLIVLALLLILVIWYFAVGRHSLKALLSGVRITPTHALTMRLRKSPLKLIVDQTIKAHKAGILVDFNILEACSLAGGDVKNVVNGLIYAKAKEIDLDITEAVQWDQQKRDIELHLKNK